jgi:DNA-binding NtrC family response regulator
LQLSLITAIVRFVSNVPDDRLTHVLSNAIVGADGVVIIRILSGPNKGQEAILLGEAPFVIGSSLEATLKLDDAAVSRKHVELINLGGIVRATDLGSTNGCHYEGGKFTELNLAAGSVFRIGETDLQILVPERSDPLPPSELRKFGGLLGKSRKMRDVFAILERAAKTDATVLVIGETGTGKEVVAEAIHRQSNRRDEPFIVVDCASIPHNLIESELFGHLKGAFTNAVSDRDGAFQAADGGTIFLDEIGEMPAVLQPRLLRALETRKVKKVGSNEFTSVDVRVIAATNRKLEDEVRAKNFRSDLYFRLAVIRADLPALRERREDIPMLAKHFLQEINAKRDANDQAELTPEVSAALSSYNWPGNVRELRNVIQQAASLSDEALTLAHKLRQAGSSQTESQANTYSGEGDGFGRFLSLPYKDARRQALEAFEECYAEHVVKQAAGNVSKAAEAAQVHRNVLHRILARKKEQA